MLKLTDEQMSALLNGARPLPAADRDAFLTQVAELLRDQPLGDGLVFRVVRDVQARFLEPPSVFERRVPLVQPRTKHRAGGGSDPNPSGAAPK